jgi:primosomal protein N' (replication factor Y)
MLAGAEHRVHRPSQAVERQGWALLYVADRRRADPRAGLYSDELVQVLRTEARRVVCVLNRKGRAVLLDCAACGEVARCEHCDSAVRLVAAELRCARCGQARPVVCAACGSDSLRSLRVGVSRAREQLEALAGRPVGEVVAGEADLPAAGVLVGTETVLYRQSELRRGSGVGAVAFLDFDQELLAPRYRAGEQALTLLARASRLVGGRESHARVLVQTRMPEHPVIEAAVMADPGRLTAAEDPVRRAAHLPPYAALALLSGPGAPAMAASLKGLSLASAGPVTVQAGRSKQPEQPEHPQQPEHPEQVEHPEQPERSGGTTVGEAGLELSEMPGGEWVLRAPSYKIVADALASVERPPERLRVEIGPVRF